LFIILSYDVKRESLSIALHHFHWWACKFNLITECLLLLCKSWNYN